MFPKRVISLTAISFALTFQALGQAKKLKPTHDPPGQLFRHAPMPKATRSIVIPLGNRSAFGNDTMQGLTPEISFGDQALLLLTPQISSVPEKHLRNPIGSLSHVRDLIIGALDLAITGF